MSRRNRSKLLVVCGCCLLTIAAAQLWARGFGGGGRGGGGGGGFRGGGGGGGFGGGGGRAPSMSRPAPRPSGGGVSRPSGGAASRPAPSRPSVANRPAGGTARPGGPSGPGNVKLPNGSTRPGNSSRPPANIAGGNRPGVSPGGNRPPINAQPGTGLGNRPNIGGGPGAATRPGAANRPAIGDRPTAGTRPAGPNRPGAGLGPGAGTRPGGGVANRPGQRPATLPGLAAGGGALAGRPGVADRAGQRQNWNDRPGARQDYMNDRVANRQDRANDLQNRMNDRHDNWQDFRNDAWDNRQDRWDDFGDNFWDNAYDMRHDYWNNRFDAWWDHMWDEHPVAMGFGITAWGVNRLSYWFGYGGGYYNPYYSDGGGGGGGSYDYSEPLPTYEQASAPVEAAAVETPPADPNAPPAAGGETSPLMAAFDAARTAFYDGDYPQAMEQVNAALKLAKNDAMLHEFRALVLFAQGQYKDAAATIHTVLAVGPGWDWTTLSGFYPSVDTYTAQLRKLEEAVTSSPKSADLRFLLAYQYITCNSTNEAIAQLKEVISLEPKDTVAVQLLEMLGGPAALPSSAAAAPPKPAGAAEAPSIPKADLVGVWKAKGEGGATFELSLTDKDAFTWKFTSGGKTTSVEGVYAIEQNTLALEPDAGGVMVAEVTPPKDGKLHFQVVGSPPGDRGLDFAK